jgi:hypothetical protein
MTFTSLHIATFKVDQKRSIHLELVDFNDRKALNVGLRISTGM